METLAAFKERIGVKSLQFMKGKGRQFCATSAGTLFMSQEFDKAQPAYVVTANIPGRPELDGSLWLVNSTLTDGDIM